MTKMNKQKRGSNWTLRGPSLDLPAWCMQSGATVSPYSSRCACSLFFSKRRPFFASLLASADTSVSSLSPSAYPTCSATSRSSRKRRSSTCRRRFSPPCSCGSTVRLVVCLGMGVLVQELSKEGGTFEELLVHVLISLYSHS